MKNLSDVLGLGASAAPQTSQPRPIQVSSVGRTIAIVKGVVKELIKNLFSCLSGDCAGSAHTDTHTVHYLNTQDDAQTSQTPSSNPLPRKQVVKAMQQTLLRKVSTENADNGLNVTAQKVIALIKIIGEKTEQRVSKLTQLEVIAIRDLYNQLKSAQQYVTINGVRTRIEMGGPVAAGKAFEQVTFTKTLLLGLLALREFCKKYGAIFADRTIITRKWLRKEIVKKTVWVRHVYGRTPGKR